MDYKVILAALGTIIGFIGYAPYVRDVLKKRTKPHIFSWLGWGLLETIALFAQIAKHAGPGTWITGTSAAIALFIAFMSLREKDKQITVLDYIVFAGAIIAIILWRITHNPLLAVIFVTLADALAFVPTFRKSFHKPDEETLTEYGLSALKWAMAVSALSTFSPTAWLYPASLVLTNTVFVTMCLIRRNKLQKT